MSSELDVCIWFTDKKEHNARARFLDLVGIFAEMDACSDNWMNFSVQEGPERKVLLELKEDFSLESLSDFTRRFESEPVQFRILVPVYVWKFSGMKAEEGTVLMGITVWSDEFHQANGLDAATMGQAQISVFDPGPYLAILDGKAAEHPDLDARNENVADNCEDFIQLLLAIVDSLPVEKMLVWHDLCDYLPHNAHLAYFRNLDAVVAEANAWMGALKQGRGKIKPLKELDEKQAAWYFHELRPAEERAALRKSLDSLISRDLEATPAGVREVLDQEEFDFFEKEDSVMVMEYPFFANAFLDEFWQQVMDGGR